MRWSVLLLALLSVANAADEPLPLRIIVTPVIAQAPSDVHLKVIIERDARNRSLQLGIDGDRYAQVSLRQVDGAQNQRVWDVWWHQVPCGVYRVMAVLTREDGTRAAQSRQITLLGPACAEPEDDL